MKTYTIKHLPSDGLLKNANGGVSQFQTYDDANRHRTFLQEVRGAAGLVVADYATGDVCDSRGMTLREALAASAPIPCSAVKLDGVDTLGEMQADAREDALNGHYPNRD